MTAAAIVTLDWPVKGAKFGDHCFGNETEFPDSPCLLSHNTDRRQLT